MAADSTLRLFEGYGIELEYMIVDRETLDVRPICDTLLAELGGPETSDWENGRIAWSNELASHVVEFKTNGPVARLEPCIADFQDNVRLANQRLAPHGAQLLPGAMHPWMDPKKEMRLWPHDSGPVYAAFDRIFDCTGHGWANLQSAHLNLPFSGDDEFGRLHAAIRAILPLLPALAASSPVMDGVITGMLDSRMQVYRHNARRVPSVSGRVVPEPLFTRGDYERELLERIYQDLAPHDPDGVLRHEWANARGAIARFDRSAIEIRVLDVQEHPAADLAIAALIRSTLMAWIDERWCPTSELRALDTDRLAALLWRSVERGGDAVVGYPELLRCLGLEASGTTTVRDVWHHVVATVFSADAADAAVWLPSIETILSEGSLSERLLRALGPKPKRAQFVEVWRRLGECLATGAAFSA